MFAGALALGLEGIVAKDSESPYVEGPRVTWHWQKIKNRYYQRKEKVEFRQKGFKLGRRFLFRRELTRFDQLGSPPKRAVRLVRLNTQTRIGFTE